MFGSYATQMVSPSYEELLAQNRQQQELLTQQADLNLFLQQEILALRQEIHRLKANWGQPPYAHLQETLRASEYVHGDETSWRENGANGYLWSFSTPALCLFTYPKTRAGSVVTDVLGAKYSGIVVSDFYGGYNTHLGLHQRCWVHLLRDVHALTEKFPLPGVLDWAKSLRSLYDRAKAFCSLDKKARAKA